MAEGSFLSPPNMEVVRSPRVSTIFRSMEAATADPIDAAAPDDDFWDTTLEHQPPPEVLQLWTEVSRRLDSNRKEFVYSGLTSLEYAIDYLSFYQEARSFAESYAGKLVDFVSAQSPRGMRSLQCLRIQDVLFTGCHLVAEDLKVQLDGRSTHETAPGKSLLLETVLPHLFSKDKMFYKFPLLKYREAYTQGITTQPADEQEANPIEYSKVRLMNIEAFRFCDGFVLLNSYLQAWLPFSSTGNPDCFPTLETLICILGALHDSLPSVKTAFFPPVDIEMELWQQKEDHARAIGQTLVQYFQQLSDEALKAIPPKLLHQTLQSLRMLMDRLVRTPRAVCMEVYTLWRSIIHTYLFSSSHVLQLAGWEEVKTMIQVGVEHRPPPRQYVVSNAGVAFVNGTYDYAGPITSDGYFPGGASVSYVRIIPADVPEFGGQKLTLFRCTMRSLAKWWFISIADEEEPGTDGDRDFYQHNTPQETNTPPTDGWILSRPWGLAPPPNLQPIGTLVPPGQEHATLEHRMVSWVMNNAIVERLFRSTNLHAAVLAPSMMLFELLTDVSHRDGDWTVAGLIPRLCELRRQREVMLRSQSEGEKPNASPGASSLPTNNSNADPTQKAFTDDPARSAKLSRKRVTMETPMGTSKQAKMELPERELRRLAREKVELRAFFEKLSHRKFELLREYGKADDEFIQGEIKSWIHSINDQMAKEQHDLQELCKKCEKYEDGLSWSLQTRTGSPTDDAIASLTRGDSCGINTTDNGRITGDGKDCSIDIDSKESSDSSSHSTKPDNKDRQSTEK